MKLLASESEKKNTDHGRHIHAPSWQYKQQNVSKVATKNQNGFPDETLKIVRKIKHV